MDQYFIILGGIVALFMFIIIPRIRESRFSSLQKHIHESDDWGETEDNRFSGENERDYEEDAWQETAWQEGAEESAHTVFTRRSDKEVNAADLVPIFSTPRKLEAMKVVALLESRNIVVYPRRGAEDGQSSEKIELLVHQEDERAATSLLNMLSHS
jgi:hypothetical protein